jgi:dihydroorotate dehydrogenase
MNTTRHLFLRLNSMAYQRIARPLIFRSSAQEAHIRIVNLMLRMDNSSILCRLFARLHQLAFEDCEYTVGGASLKSPFILAAGLVKGESFAAEDEALAAVNDGHNIIPGWRSIPHLVGQVEFGSFTRHPRLGNPGTVVWRDEQTLSTQNRVGLKNPGALAAAAFLAQHRADLPRIWGINIAVSPGVDDVEQQKVEILESVDAFLKQGIYPTWFTVNLSCPNTEDDPAGNQTESLARTLFGALVDHLRTQGFLIPVWVKISPALSDDQYRILLGVFQDVGVRAVIATNTLPQAAPSDTSLMAGVGGGRLHNEALRAVCILADEKKRQNYTVDIIGCGGLLDGDSYNHLLSAGSQAVQYWSALIYRGPLAAAVIQDEFQYG